MAPAVTAVDAGSGSGASAKPCELAGSYRLRFASNGHDGWWFRFRITSPSAAELTAPLAVLGIEKAGPLAIDADPASCKVVVTATGTIGAMRAELVLDPATNAVTGQLVRVAPRDDGEKTPAPMRGMRDAAGTPSTPPKRACIKPGIYKLTFDPQPKWTSQLKGKDCMPQDSTRVRVEHLGDELFVDQLESGTDDASSGSEQVTRVGDCEAEVTIGGNEVDLGWSAKLTFADGKVTGTAATATQQMIEDGTDGEAAWECTAKNLAIVGAWETE